MKKFAKITAVVLVAVMALAVLVACGPASDPKKAEKALKDNGYTVVAVIGADGALVQAGLDAIAVAAGLEKGDIIATVTANKGSDGISITYFKSASAAKSFWNDKKDDLEKKEDDWVVKCSGSIIYAGTKQAVKDAK